jgi:hypothetical protein
MLCGGHLFPVFIAVVSARTHARVGFGTGSLSGRGPKRILVGVTRGGWMYTLHPKYGYVDPTTTDLSPGMTKTDLAQHLNSEAKESGETLRHMWQNASKAAVASAK